MLKTVFSFVGVGEGEVRGTGFDSFEFFCVELHRKRVHCERA